MSVELDNSCFSWNVAFKAADDAKLLNTHIEDYSKMAQIYVERVSRLWNELGFSRGDRQQEFDEVATAIRSVWSATSDRAERKKRERQQEIDDAVAEIYKYDPSFPLCFYPYSFGEESRKSWVTAHEIVASKGSKVC